MIFEIESFIFYFYVAYSLHRIWQISFSVHTVLSGPPVVFPSAGNLVSCLLTTFSYPSYLGKAVGLCADKLNAF